MTMVMEKAWGSQKLCLVEELIKVIFGLHKDECQWFRVRPGSVILDFLVPQSLITPTIVRCVSKMEFMRLIGVIELHIGSILVLREHKDKSFSFHDSLLMACKCANVELAEFLLNFFQIDINKSSITFLKENSLSFSRDIAHIIVQKLQFDFSMIATNFIAFIESQQQIKLESLKSFIQEERQSFTKFFTSATTKVHFFEIAKHFFDFLNCSFLVAIEKSLNLRYRCLKHNMISEYSTQLKLSKNYFPFADFVNKCQKLVPQPAGTVLIHLHLPDEWLNCSVSMFENLVYNVFALKHSDELQLLKVRSGSVVAVFYAPQSLEKQLIDTSKKKVEFMRLLGVIALQVGDDDILKNNNGNYTFEKGLAEAKEKNQSDVLQFLSEVFKDMILIRHARNNDENNNLLF